ncbi:MAG: 50S ribosomal protein L9 [Buchnera aphidicola (Periphyllus acericola)]|uniref:50S ribosomal protein L9 n=1 Tax=Buchnera aphidicola TaxID=9 RepID=UPI0030D616D8|nr:50S ribosomal protein L9 [Buchnera aphidicola (Periphyllus acericola)]
MKVILLITFKKLGSLGDVIEVKPGYARNFLFPKDIALPAIQENIQYFKNYKRKLQEKLLKEVSIAKLRIKEIKKIKDIVIYSKSGSQGKLFGSINARDISRKLNELGIKVYKSEIKLKNRVIRSVGNHSVLFQPHKNINSEITITVVSEKK